MKNWKGLILIFVVSASFAFYRNYFNKNEKTDFNEILIDNLYSVEVPDYLKKTDIINGEASLQMMDESKRLYLLVINEAKTETVFEYNEYFDKMQERFELQLSNLEIIDKKDLVINGLNSKYTYLQGVMNGQPMYGKIYLIDGEKYFHQLITWTGLDNNKYFENDMSEIIDSFKEK